MQLLMGVAYFIVALLVVRALATGHTAKRVAGLGFCHPRCIWMT